MEIKPVTFPNNAKHVLSFSGGKDSGAMYLLAMDMGIDFLPVFADTGNEHPITLDYVRNFARLAGGPAVRWVKADFTEDFARKKRYVKNKWPDDGVSPKKVKLALESLHQTGIPFLDLCLFKGRFPSTKARFCSEELKHNPIFFQVQEPLMEAGHHVYSWQGIRADESKARATLPVSDSPAPNLTNYRPILSWSVEDVIAIHKRHNVPLNPLYSKGFKRVGCMPCIHQTKEGIRNIADRLPGEIDRIDEWERLVGQAGKREIPWASFFAADKTPGDHQVNHNLDMPGIREVVRWSRTGRGGRNFVLPGLEAPINCLSDIPCE